jgi:hypothetical protein
MKIERREVEPNPPSTTCSAAQTHNQGLEMSRWEGSSSEEEALGIL